MHSNMARHTEMCTALIFTTPLRGVQCTEACSNLTMANNCAIIGKKKYVCKQWQIKLCEHVVEKVLSAPPQIQYQ